MADNNGCTCGSGGHPRRCEKHPWAYGQHVADLSHDGLVDEHEETKTRLNAALQRIEQLELEVARLKNPRAFIQSGADNSPATTHPHLSPLPDEGT